MNNNIGPFILLLLNSLLHPDPKIIITQVIPKAQFHYKPNTKPPFYPIQTKHPFTHGQLDPVKHLFYKIPILILPRPKFHTPTQKMYYYKNPNSPYTPITHLVLIITP